MITFSPKQSETIKAPFIHTLEVLEGTPRSSKTTTGIFRFARNLMETEDENHLIVAYNQEQAYRLIIEGDGMGLKHIFGSLAKDKMDKKMGQYLEITTHNGVRRVFYRGGGKSNDVGAVTGMSLGSIYFCEINLLHMNMIQECFRRTFAAKRRFHIADLNPPSPMHPVIKEVFEVQDTKWTHWTPDDNPILTEKRKEELKAILSKSDYLYKRDWLGQRVLPSGIIYSMFNMERHVINLIPGRKYEMYFVADGGQSDATSCSCNIVVYDEGKYKLLRVANYYHSGRDTGEVKAMSIYAREIKEFMKYCTETFNMQHSEFFVDPACRSLREELHLLGISTRGADNNGKDVTSNAKGIEVGIERMQSLMQNDQFFVVENEFYGHYDLFKNFGMYVRLDNGKPIDKFNDNLDEMRYASNYFYRRYIM